MGHRFPEFRVAPDVGARENAIAADLSEVVGKGCIMDVRGLGSIGIGVADPAGLGKHTNDHMVSFSSRSPSGFDVEFGCGGRLVDDSTWTVAEITKPSFWGHRPPVG